jgi:hypothetical protein
MHDGQLPHVDHAQFARRVILPQVALLHILVIGINVPSFRSDTRGVRVVTNVERNAVDAKMLETCSYLRGRRSRVVLAPQGPGVKLSWDFKGRARATVAIGMVHRGERGVSRKPSRGEGRCDHRLYLWSSRSRKFFLREAPGASGHPVFPAPSESSEGQQ